jgi:hypothetical protein
VQTVVAARAYIHRNPPLKLDPSEFRVKKGTSKEIEEQMAAEKKRMEIAEAKQARPPSFASASSNHHNLMTFTSPSTFQFLLAYKTLNLLYSVAC